jgi:hypothetical protein
MQIFGKSIGNTTNGIGVKEPDRSSQHCGKHPVMEDLSSMNAQVGE